MNATQSWGSVHREFILPDRPIKVGLVAYSPFANPCIATVGYPHEDCPDGGIDVELLYTILAAINATIEPVLLPSVSNWGAVQTDGSITGLLDDISKGAIDTTAVWWMETSHRVPHFDYSYYTTYSVNNFGFILRRPSSTLDIEASGLMFSVFNGSVWAIVATGFVVAAIGATISDNLYMWYKGRYKKWTFQRVWCCVETCLDQDDLPLDSTNISGNLINVLLGFLALFFISLYAGGLVDVLLMDKTTLPFHSSSELAPLLAAGRYRMIKDNGTGNTFWWGKVANPKSEAFWSVSCVTTA